MFFHHLVIFMFFQKFSFVFVVSVRKFILTVSLSNVLNSVFTIKYCLYSSLVGVTWTLFIPRLLFLKSTIRCENRRLWGRGNYRVEAWRLGWILEIFEGFSWQSSRLQVQIQHGGSEWVKTGNVGGTGGPAVSERGSCTAGKENPSELLEFRKVRRV